MAIISKREAQKRVEALSRELASAGRRVVRVENDNSRRILGAGLHVVITAEPDERDSYYLVLSFFEPGTSAPMYPPLFVRGRPGEPNAVSDQDVVLNVLPRFDLAPIGIEEATRLVRERFFAQFPTAERQHIQAADDGTVTYDHIRVASFGTTTDGRIVVGWPTGASAVFPLLAAPITEGDVDAAVQMLLQRALDPFARMQHDAAPPSGTP